MQQVFDVRFPTSPTDTIDEDAEILILAQPGKLDIRTLYAIDQFVMRGGRILAFVDPFTEALAQPGPGGTPPEPAGDAIKTMEPLFKAWGIEIPSGQVVGDRGVRRAGPRHSRWPPGSDRLPALAGLERQRLHRGRRGHR